MIRLLRFLKPCWKPALAAPLFMFLEVFMDLLQPTLMSDIVDNGVAKGDLAYVLAMSGRMILAALAGAVGGVGCTVFSSIAAMEYGTGLRQTIFDRVQTFSFAELDQLKTSSLITRLTNDIMQLQNLVIMGLRMMVRAPLLVIGGAVMAIAINARLAIILLVAMPLLVVSIALITRKGFPMFGDLQRRIDRINDVTRENLTGIRVVKAFVREDHEMQRFDRANGELMASGVRVSRLMMWMWPIMTLLLNMSIVAALWFGGRMVLDGGILSGQVMAFINYLMQILFSMMMLSMILMGASSAKASADRINEVLDVKTTIADPAKPKKAEGSEGSVEFRDVSFRYPGAEGEPALRHLSFTAKAGQTIGILGATGSGKSSLVNLIPRLYDATEGSVLVGGVDVREMALDDLRQRIAMAPQQSILFSGSVQENLLWGDEAAGDDAVRAAAADAQADGFVQALDKGYATTLGQRGVNLSGGQKQRLSIARALLRKPDILILDDATSAVDMATEAKLQGAIRARMGSCTIFIIAQRISSVLEADQIFVMDDGRIVARGTHSELLRSSDIYRDIVQSQLGEEALAHV